jgi:hypothetical protein
MQIVDSAIPQIKLPDLTECCELVERIAASVQLRRSARLRDLLLFVARRHLKEGCTQLHEQEIGIEVFGRAQTYDTNVDNIVRANVSELRKRIDAYFDDEGRKETLIVELPRGSYVPVFSFRPAAIPVPVEVPQPVPASAPAVATPDPSVTATSFLGVLFGSRLVAAAFVALLVCTVITLGIQNLSLRASLEANQRSFYPWRYEPTVASFWSNFLDVPQETDVLVPDASFSQIQSFSQTSI